ncbi:Spo0B domain-containing protein [Paenibacillus sp. UNC496MF]|uniref:Spo0B domain-containing protein n=1 Tax=Paenibacillus sp. UNC496MF TaxID=1502753 RepID=UPI00210896E6|nr:Spo0B domain-containing protein [Paenibacillus sp. UNC496MF]
MHRWLIAIFLAWTACAAVLWNRSLAAEQAGRRKDAERAIQRAAIATLNHHRHDWMNDLQIVYGYIRMGKTDKTIQCVEQIRERMQTESKIAKLGVPALVLFLQSFRTTTNAMVIDMDIDGEVNLAELFPNGERAAHAIIELIRAYREAAASNGGEPAKLLVDLSAEEDKLMLSFYFDGELASGEAWKKNCELALKGAPLEATEWDPDKGTLMLEAQLGK